MAGDDLPSSPRSPALNMDQLELERDDVFRPSTNLQGSPALGQHVHTNLPQTPPAAASRILLPTIPTPQSRIPIPTTLSSSRNIQRDNLSRNPTSQVDPSLLETLFFDNPLRHLASHSTINSHDSGSQSRARSRSRSHSRARVGSTSTHARLGSVSTITSEAATSQNRYAFPPRREQPLRPHARNFEEQRHSGKPNLSITRNTKRYDPHYEQRSSTLKDEEADSDAVGGVALRSEGLVGSRVETLRFEAARASGGHSRPGSPAKNSTPLVPVRTESGVNSASDGTTLFEDHRRESLTTKEKVDEDVPGAVLENLAPPETKEEEDETVYPGPLGLIFLSIGLMLCVFLISLDRTIITPAIPFIVNEFQSYEDIGWYGSAYLLTAASFQPMYGRIFTLFDIKWSYLFALGMFELGSLICGVAPNSVCLIVGRAIAGLGSAGILTGSFVVCSHAVPLAKRPTLTAVVGLMFGVGATVGPLLGGVFTDYSTWRWAFYFNLPVGGATAIALILFFKPNAKHALMDKSFSYRIFELDLVGNVIILGAAVQLFLALQYTEQHIPWSDQLVIGLLVGSFATFVVFCVWMWWKADGALIPPRIIGQRTVAASCAVAFFLYSATLIHMFYLPFWFQAIQGVSATRSGVNLIPYVIATAVFTLLAGIFVSKNGYFTIPAIAGCAIATVGCGLLSMLDLDIGTRWVGYEICAAAGIGMAVQQGFSAVQIVLPLDEVAIGTAAVVAFQSLGGAIFVSVGNTILQNSLISAGRNNLLPGIDVQSIIDAGASAFRDVVTPAQLPALLQVYNDALRRVFICSIPLCGLAFISSLFLEWRNVKDELKAKGEKRLNEQETKIQRESANSSGSGEGGVWERPKEESIV